MYILATVILILTVLFGKKISEEKLYVFLGVISIIVLQELQVDPLTFAAIVTAQTVTLWIATDFLMGLLPDRMWVNFTFGDQRVVFGMVAA